MVHSDVTARQRKSVDQRHRYGVVTYLLYLRHPLSDLENSDDVYLLCDVALMRLTNKNMLLTVCACVRARACMREFAYVHG